MNDADSFRDDLAASERPHYFAGMLVGADDLEQEQTYHRHQNAAHARAVHGDGTVCGLAVRQTDPPSRALVVEAGRALDRCGREIVVPSQQTIDLDEKRIARTAGRIVVAVRFAEVAEDPAPSLAEPEEGRTHPHRSIRESFELEVSDCGELDVESHRGSFVAGESAEMSLEGVHELLVRRAIRPCESGLDQRVPLAMVSMPTTGPVTAVDIDNSACPVVLTADLVGLLLGQLLTRQESPPTRWQRLRRALRRR